MVMPPKRGLSANPNGNKKPKKVRDSDNLPNSSEQSEKKREIVYRCSTKSLLAIMKDIIKNDNLKGYVGEIGFGSFLSLADADVGKNKALTLWLVDRFNCDTEALEFEGNISIPVRPLVKSVLGIPSGPIQVVEDPDADDPLHAQYTCDAKGKPKTTKEVAEKMCCITDKEQFCVAFMMAILGIYLAPNSSMDVNRALLGAVKQVDKLKDMDWCNFVATYLFNGIKEFKTKKESPGSRNIYIKGCVHILSVIFIDFVKKPAAFEVPIGFPRLAVVTKKHFKWVVSHPFSSLTLHRPEESVYAAVLDNMTKDSIVEDGKCAISEINTDALADKFAITVTDQNGNKHLVSAEIGTDITSPRITSLAIVEHLELGTSPRSAGDTIFLRSGEQVQSSRPSEPCSAQIREMMHVAADAPKGVDSSSTVPMENAGVDRNAKKVRVDSPSSSHAKKRAEGVAALDMSLLNCTCTLCCRPCKPPVFQCKGRHLACGRCLAELPGEQCQTCEHGGGFSHCPIMDDVVSLAMVECSHDGCKSSLPYHELDDHKSVCPHAPCCCMEPGCGFAGPPSTLLGHLAALHSVPVHTVHYGEVHRFRVSEPRCLLRSVGDDKVFLLAVGTLGMATIVSVVCIRAGPLPRYAVKLWANGPPPPSSAAGSVLLDMKTVASSTRPAEVAVEELPSFLMVPPAYLVESGASKEVILDIRIDKM